MPCKRYIVSVIYSIIQIAIAQHIIDLKVVSTLCASILMSSIPNHNLKETNAYQGSY